MARVTEMHYPNGWVEYYTYDNMGRLLAVDDTHPSEKPAKTQKHTYQYDANGNILREYMRGNGTGQAKNDTSYTYDALNRLVTAHDNYGNSTRTYTYDTLGNLTYETGNGSHNTDYRYNNLNQEVDRSVDGWKSHTASTYDDRGNLILETYNKNNKSETAGEYTFDETNKMVEGVNANGEQSIYSYNGLGALMENTWVIAKNGYGYHNVSATAVVEGEVVVDAETGARQEKVRLTPEELEAANAAEDAALAEAAAAAEEAADIPETAEIGETPENGSIQVEEDADTGALTGSLVLAATAGGNGNNGNQSNGNGTQDKPTGSDVNKTSTVVKQFVVDFSREDYKPLMEQEVNGLTYRYVNSDKARLSVVVQGIENGSSSLLDANGELHAYYHTDYLGTTDYLTSAVNSKVISWTSYNEWGEITHNAVLKCGQRELDLVKEYATHDYDAVLDLYYAKARFYDAYNRMFTAQDPILDPSQYDLREYVKEPMALVQYLYVRDNAINLIDLLGLVAAVNSNAFGTRTIRDNEYATLTDIAWAFDTELTKMNPSSTSYYAFIGGTHLEYNEVTNRITLTKKIGNSWKTQNISASKQDEIDSAVAVDIRYFCQVLCTFGNHARLQIGSQNSGLTSEDMKKATIEYSLSRMQKEALHLINTYLLTNPELSKKTTVYALEGAGNVSEPWGNNHPYGQYNAMILSVANGNDIVALTKKGSTLPDQPQNGKAVTAEGIYSLTNYAHGSGRYAAATLNHAGTVNAIRNKQDSTANGINFHTAYTSSNPSSWSEGCIVVDISDYIQFGVNTGFLNPQALDFPYKKYSDFKETFSAGKYGQSFSGYIVIDRSILEEKLLEDQYTEAFEYYFGA